MSKVSLKVQSLLVVGCYKIKKKNPTHLDSIFLGGKNWGIQTIEPKWRENPAARCPAFGTHTVISWTPKGVTVPSLWLPSEAHRASPQAWLTPHWQPSLVDIPQSWYLQHPGIFITVLISPISWDFYSNWGITLFKDLLGPLLRDSNPAKRLPGLSCSLWPLHAFKAIWVILTLPSASVSSRCRLSPWTTATSASMSWSWIRTFVLS